MEVLGGGLGFFDFSGGEEDVVSGFGEDFDGGESDAMGGTGHEGSFLRHGWLSVVWII